MNPTYDANGNMTLVPTNGSADSLFASEATYDAWNHLVTLVTASLIPQEVVGAYGYDALGRRITKTTMDGAEDFYYSSRAQMIEARRNGIAAPEEQTVYGLGYVDAPVVQFHDTNTDGVIDQVLYLLQDANFDVTAAVDGATGQVVNRFVYTPYGQRKVYDGSWGYGLSDVKLGRQGLYQDAESGLYYNRERYYDPMLGRFTSPDPIGYPDGMNRYEYVRGNPVNGRDPTGLFLQSFVLAPTTSANLLNSSGPGLFVIGWIAKAINDRCQAEAAEVDRVYANQLRWSKQLHDLSVANWQAQQAALTAPMPQPSPTSRPSPTTQAVNTAVAALQAQDEPKCPIKNSATTKPSTTQPVGGRRAFSASEREKLWNESNGKCEYCGENLTKESGTGNSFEADHRTPYSKGGETSVDNAAASCRTCNRSKGGKTLGEQWIPPRDR